MTYKALIIDTTTGEQRAMADSFEYHDSTEFLWTEGNFGCDCNRGIFFDRAADQEKDWDEDAGDTDPYPCGSKRYRVPQLILEDGTLVAIDEETGR